MKIGEILRKLADIADQSESNGVPAGPQSATLYPASAETEDHTDKESMIAPLQQKLELLKKSAGVESFYDNDEVCDACHQSPCACGGEEVDPMDDMKRLAGIVQIVGGEDTDMDF